MADDQADEGPEDGLDDIIEEESGGMKKTLLLLIPLILICAGAALYFTGNLDSLLGKGGEHEESAAEKEHEEEAHDEAAAFVEIPDLIVNLQSNDQPHFLRLKIRLEVKNEDDAAAVGEILPRVIDQFQTFLREMRMQDLRGSAGIYRLRQELLYRVNIATRPIEVQDVLFQEILVQ